VEDDATATALLNRLTGGVAPDLDQIWAEEWEKLVLAAAHAQNGHTSPRRREDSIARNQLNIA
jgi:hypothetical protein